MQQRDAHTWVVDLVQMPGGQQAQEKVTAHWDPAHVLTSDSVALAATTQAWVKAGKRDDVRFVAPTSPELVR